jgi:hypothetical protein
MEVKKRKQGAGAKAKRKKLFTEKWRSKMIEKKNRKEDRMTTATDSTQLGQDSVSNTTSGDKEEAQMPAVEQSKPIQDSGVESDSVANAINKNKSKNAVNASLHNKLKLVSF